MPAYKSPAIGKHAHRSKSINPKHELSLSLLMQGGRYTMNDVVFLVMIESQRGIKRDQVPVNIRVQK